jgi:hydrophobe/amphiphile efflux-3 (HAE3) family protein
MSGMGNSVSKRPGVTIVIILVLTIVFSVFGSAFENNADPESFNPDHELINASIEAGDTFGTQSYSLLIIVKDTDDNLLEIDDLKTMIDCEYTFRGDPTIASAIVPSQSNPTGFASLAGLVVTSYGLLFAREDLNNTLTSFNENLSIPLSILQDLNINDTTKAVTLDNLLISLNESLSEFQNGNNGMIPEFNRTLSLGTLDLISFLYGPDPVPNYLNELNDYDIVAAITQTATLKVSLENQINSLKGYLHLLNNTEDETNAAILLGTLESIISTLESQAQTVDETIVGINYGIQATLTRDYGTSGGTSAKGTIININFDVNLDRNERFKVENTVDTLAKNHEGNLEFGVLGDQLINNEIEETMDLSGMVLLGLVFVLIVIILFFTFRSGFDTFLTLISLGMAIMWSFGISVLLGLEGSIIATVVPILLVGLGVDYGIHMTMRFREEKEKANTNRKAIAIAISTVGMALLLATITTSIGFMSNTVSSLTILRDFAIMVTAGIVSSFIIMTTFLPAVRLVMSSWRDRRMEKKGKTPKPKKSKNNSKKHAVSVVTIGAKAGDRAPWAVLIILFIISGIAGYGASQLSTVFDFREFIPRDTDAYNNYVFLIDEFEFGDTEFGEIYIKGDVADTEVLLAMNQTIANTQDGEQVLGQFPAWSILSIAQEYSTLGSQNYDPSFAENWTAADSDFDGIPDGNVRALFDMLYSNPQANADVISVIHRDNTTGNYDAALLQLRVNSDNLKKADALVDELKIDSAPLRALEGTTLDKVYVIGEPVVINVVVTEMNEGQIRSIIITIAASFIVLTIVFFLLERSFILGLITIIPVVLVILWILGTMLIFGYNLNVMTITIASLTVGMGITYSIHVSERFTEDLRKFKTPGEACENTLTHTGMALAGAFLTTSGGFGILFLHQLPPLQQFGVMIALSIAYSFLASAYVLPTFLILWAKWRNNYRAKRGIPQNIMEDENPEKLGKEDGKIPDEECHDPGKEQDKEPEDDLEENEIKEENEVELEVKPKVN